MVSEHTFGPRHPPRDLRLVPGKGPFHSREGLIPLSGETPADTSKGHLHKKEVQWITHDLIILMLVRPLSILTGIWGLFFPSPSSLSHGGEAGNSCFVFRICLQYHLPFFPSLGKSDPFKFKPFAASLLDFWNFQLHCVHFLSIFFYLCLSTSLL